MRVTDVYAFQNGSGEFSRRDPRLLKQAVEHCLEEVNELKLAYEHLMSLHPDASEKAQADAMVDLLDAAIDLRYVAVNVAFFVGCPAATFIAASTEVHTCNMKKLEPRPVRDANGKIVKPAGWKPPSHRAIRWWLANGPDDAA